MIFVFGSNLAGRHGAGAARFAALNYGAVYGVGEGRTGQAYALPTKNEYLQVLPVAIVTNNIAKFCAYARDNPELTFAVTPVGTGLAGFPKKFIWEAFRLAGTPKNCYLTSTWLD